MLGLLFPQINPQAHPVWLYPNPLPWHYTEVKIILFKGGAEYNAFNRFAEHLGEGFAKLGHDVDLLDLQTDKKNALPNIAPIIEGDPDLIVSFNATGADLKIEGQSIYNLTDCYFLELLLDHPAFHTGRIQRSPKRAIAGVVDRTHLDYLEETWAGHPLFFAPHGGIQHADCHNEDRPIDVLFLGTGLDPQKERAAWKNFPKHFQRLLEESYESFLEKPQPWATLLKESAHRMHIHLPTNLMASLIIQLEIVMRADYRVRILKQFDQAGIKVTIMGNHWEHANFTHHEVHPSVEFHDALKLICKSKVALNASPQFFTGTHERVFAAMLNGALAITSASDYYKEHFTDGEHYLSFNLNSLPDTLQELKDLMAHPKRFAEVRQNAMTLAQKNHTWDARAGEFLDKLQSLAMTQFLYQNL